MQGISADSATTPVRVLVVDDERHIRTTLRACIEGEGHRIEGAATAREALTAAAREAFDVAFLDLRLGADDGLDLIGPLLEQRPGLKIIVITAHATVESAVEAMKRGAADYLPKPFEPAQVRIVLRRAAELRALERDVESLRESLGQAQPEMQLASENAAMQGLDVSGGQPACAAAGEPGVRRARG